MRFENLIVCLSILCFFQFEWGQGAKILFFFAGGTYSHKMSVWPFVTALADRGHNVTFISPFPKRPYDHPLVKDVAPKAMAEAMGRQFQNVDRLAQRQRGDEKYVWLNYHQDLINLCRAILGTVDVEPELHRIFHGEDSEENRYDVLINNAIFGDCGYILAHRHMVRGTKLIIWDSTYPLFWGPDTFGFPSEASWIPDFDSIGDFPMGFCSRVVNHFKIISWYFSRVWEVFPQIEEMMKKMYGLDNAPALIETERQASLILVASHYTTDHARSLPPFVVWVGGMQCWQNRNKTLQGEFKEFLDSATDGAILIAFGSTIDLSKMPAEFKKTFFDMMTKFPKLKFIWRWDGPLPPDYPSNLKFSKWLPQFEILGHPNTKAFISHAGLNSLSEATYQGKPVILLPLFSDQDYNGYRVQAYEIGIRLEVRTLTPKVMEDAVREILTDEKYTNNMKKMSALMRDRPMDPIETAVYYTEFVLRHENMAPLKPLNQLNIFQRRMWDIFILATFLLSIIMVGVGAGIFWCVKKIFGHSKMEEWQNGKKSKGKSKVFSKKVN